MEYYYDQIVIASETGFYNENSILILEFPDYCIKTVINTDNKIISVMYEKNQYKIKIHIKESKKNHIKLDRLQEINNLEKEEKNCALTYNIIKSDSFDLYIKYNNKMFYLITESNLDENLNNIIKMSKEDFTKLINRISKILTL